MTPSIFSKIPADLSDAFDCPIQIPLTLGIEMDQKEIVEKILIDPNFNAYEQFFDHAWCERIVGLVKSSPLKAAVEGLMVAWRGTDGVHRLPWIMVKNLQAFADGEFEGQSRHRANYAERIIEGIVETLDYRIQLKHDQRVLLKRAIAKIEEEAFQELKAARAQVKMDLAGYWASIIQKSEFQFSLFGAQGTNYGTLFFAYEDFLANVIRTKDPTYTSKNKRIKTQFSKHFGVLLTDFCWNHEEVEIAMLVRHAMAHNGARYGPALDKFKTRFVDATGTTALLRGNMFNTVNEKIQIMPCNTTYLFGVLKDRVTRIVEELA